MRVIIQPSAISGTIHAPASKSSMQRACAASLVRKGESIINNPGTSNDDKAALAVIKALGAKITSLDGSIRITSNGVQPVADTVNCGESGLGIRMFAPIVALSEKEITIKGEGSLLGRPMDFFDEVLPQLGVRIRSNKGRLPITLTGPLVPSDIDIDGSLSSQFLTGLLFAYAASGAQNVSIRVNNLKSRPYVDLTLAVMEKFGLPVPVNHRYEAFEFTAAQHTPDALEEYGTVAYTVEGDWSGGAFLLVAGAMAGKVTVKGLDLESTQADKKVLEALRDCNSGISVLADSISFNTRSVLKAFRFDATDCPDLFPPLVALASVCEGTSVVRGVRRLTHKESNRAITLQEEFGKLGITVELQDNDMWIYGGKPKGAHVHSHHDHRIAMACAVAALVAVGETIIDDAEAINKSYPDFYEHLQQLGALILKQNEVVNH